MKIFIFIILLNFFSFKGYSDYSPLGYLKNGVSNLAPFHIIRSTAEKISSFGLNKLFYGFTSLFIINEAYKSGIFEEKDNFDVQANDRKSNLRKIRSKGQIHTNGLDDNEAQRRALEDALYFASIKGGVQVHGFSSIDNETNISENFTVKPKSKILDYKILKSYKEDNVYIVEIDAIVGNISNETSCRNRNNINIKEFKGNKTIVTNIPKEIDRYIHILDDQISYHLKRDKNINYVDNKKDYHDFNVRGFDKSFDYISLVNGTNDIRHGDFLYIPSIKISKTKIYPKTFLIKNDKLPIIDNYKIFDADAIKVEFSIDIYNGVSNTLVENIQQKYLIPLNTDSNFEIIELLTKVDIEYLNQEFINISNDIYNIIKTKLFCEPILAKIQLVNNILQVPLGTRHGLKKNQLAVIESEANNWTMLSISNIGLNNSVLTPLNSSVVLEELSGKQTRFLE